MVTTIRIWNRKLLVKTRWMWTSLAAQEVVSLAVSLMGTTLEYDRRLEHKTHPKCKSNHRRLAYKSIQVSVTTLLNALSSDNQKFPPDKLDLLLIREVLPLLVSMEQE
jgi:hypothetical protein